MGRVIAFLDRLSMGMGWLAGLPPLTDPSRYVRGPHGSGAHHIEHLDGVPWHDALVPPRRHYCWPQSRGHVTFPGAPHLDGPVQRCACGAISSDGKYWSERNARRSVSPSSPQ